MRYIWYEGHWVPLDVVAKQRRAQAPCVIGDLKEYRAVGLPGSPWIGSRSTHRELLRRHKMVEVGTMSEDSALRAFPANRN